MGNDLIFKKENLENHSGQNNTLSLNTSRIPALDSLRAIMMLLGLIVHSAITYGVVNWGDEWPLKDPVFTHASNDYIVELIHVFRMPIFFLVAGFFGAMLFYERKPLKMVKNRISRILLPFIVFVIFLRPAIIFAFIYTSSVFAGDKNVLDNIIEVLSNPLAYIPTNTFHLWFLFYLIPITGTAVVIGLFLQRFQKLTSRITQLFNWLLQKPMLRVLFFASITFSLYLFMGTSKVSTPGSFIPEVNTFVYFLFFYFFGWVLFKSKHLLEQLMRFDWICVVLGLAIFSFTYLRPAYFIDEMSIVAKAITVWLFIFGITGLFIHYFSAHSSLMRYISDASYWVYLVHFPIAVLIPGLIVNWAIPSTFKFLIVLSGTGFICFLSYHYLVRATVIGKFLNGRKYSRKMNLLPVEQK